VQTNEQLGGGLTLVLNLDAINVEAVMKALVKANWKKVLAQRWELLKCLPPPSANPIWDQALCHKKQNGKLIDSISR
jgi:hypothetical protein